MAQGGTGMSASLSSKRRQEIYEASIPSHRANPVGSDEMGQLHVRIIGTVRPLDEDGTIHHSQHRKIVETVSDPDRDRLLPIVFRETSIPSHEPVSYTHL